jgi:hypothetical protein
VYARMMISGKWKFQIYGFIYIDTNPELRIDI